MTKPLSSELGEPALCWHCLHLTPQVKWHAYLAQSRCLIFFQRDDSSVALQSPPKEPQLCVGGAFLGSPACSSGRLAAKGSFAPTLHPISQQVDFVPTQARLFVVLCCASRWGVQAALHQARLGAIFPAGPGWLALF